MDAATLEGLLVREIRKATEISRRDLADRLGVARSTAGRRVDSLIERGLLREKGIEERSEAGRPKRLLELCGSYGAFVGLDFDARYLFATLVDFSQRTLEERQIRLPSQPNRNTVLEAIRETIREFSWHASGLPFLGYGIGVPGRVRQEDRIALSYPYIKGWENVDLASELNLSRELIQIENNTRTIALGEYWLGSETPAEHLVCISVRTGISAAVIAGGQLLRGHHEMAGEIRGWNTIDSPDGKPESAWLENNATVRSISPNGMPSEKEWRNFVSACQEKKAKALSILDRITSHHADAVARLVQLADPELVVLSGAFAEIGDLYFDQLRERTGDLLAGHYFCPPPIRPVFKQEFTGAHGAAALAAQSFRPD